MTKDCDGSIHLFRPKAILHATRNSYIKEYKSIEDSHEYYVVKYAQSGSYTENQKRLKAIKNEYNQVEFLHRDEHGGIQKELHGIQDQFLRLINIQSDPHLSIKFGVMSKKYDTDASCLKRSNCHKDCAPIVMKQLFQELQFLKERSVRHCDIKPTNIICRVTTDHKNLIVHMADFEDAQSISDDAPISSFSKKPCCTTYYYHENDIAAHEDLVYKLERLKEKLRDKAENSKRVKILKAKIRTLLHAWDMYSLCATLHHLFTRQSYTNNAGRLFQRELLTQFEIPDHIIDLLEQGLCDNYKNRPSPQDFLNALADWST